MARKKTMILFLFLLFALNYNFVTADETNGKYEFETPMTDFIPDYLDYIRKKIIETQKVNAKFSDDDLFVLIYKTLNGKNKGRENLQINTPFTMILFDKFEEHKDIEIVTIQVIKDFLKGEVKNIKEIFWFNNGSPLSWSRGTEELRQEKACGCGCVDGRFSMRICSHKDCPMKKEKNERRGDENF